MKKKKAQEEEKEEEDEEEKPKTTTKKPIKSIFAMKAINLKPVKQIKAAEHTFWSTWLLQFTTLGCVVGLIFGAYHM